MALGAGQALRLVVYGKSRYRDGGLDGKVQALVGSPALGEAVAHVGLRVELLEVGVGGFVINAFFEVDDDVGVAGAGRKGVAVEAHAGGGRKLGPNAVVVERHGVVAGAGGFAAVRVAREVALVRRRLPALVGADGPGIGHNEHVAEVGGPGAAEVGVRKPDQEAIGVVIA